MFPRFLYYINDVDQVWFSKDQIIHKKMKYVFMKLFNLTTNLRKQKIVKYKKLIKLMIYTQTNYSKSTLMCSSLYQMDEDIKNSTMLQIEFNVFNQ